MFNSCSMVHDTLSQTLRHMSSTPVIRLVSVGILVIFSLRWMVTHDYDREFGPGPASRPTAEVDNQSINWDQYKYVQIVATPENLCSAVMIWAQIEEYGSRAPRLMLYPSSWDQEKVIQTQLTNGLTTTTRLLWQTARESYVKLQPVESLNKDSTWTNPAYSKLLAFNLTEFSRVLVLDPASEVRQNMDETFLLPNLQIAMPYTYFGDSIGWEFSPHLMLVSPSTTSFAAVEKAVKEARSKSHDVAKAVEKAIREAGSKPHDLEIIEQVFPNRIQRLNHKQYGFMTSELRQGSHAQYLGSRSMKWDLDLVLKDTKLLHFSDPPILKPWFKASQCMLNKHMPKCVKTEWFGGSDCRDREAWFKLYRDYARKRRAVCGVDFEVKEIVGEERVLK